MKMNRTQRRWWIVAVAACSCMFAPSAFAHDKDTGFEVGFRVGYGIPLGSASDGEDLSDGISGQVPLAIDLGYRVIPNLTVGLFAHYGFGFVGDRIEVACDASSEVSCSAHDIRLGIQAHYHFQPRQKLDPWIGLGLGYEWLGIDIEGENADIEVTETVDGFEFFNLQAGLDIQVVEHFYVGPFVTLAVGQYESISIDCSTAAVTVCDRLGTTQDIADGALHEWLILGVRGVFAP